MHDLSNLQTPQLWSAVEHSANFVILTDTRGRIQYVNPSFLRVTGYTLDEVLGQSPRLVKSGDQPPEVYEGLWKTITSGREWHGILSNRTKGGERFWVSSTISVIRNADGAITNFLAIQEDITDRRKAELALMESEQRFRELAENVREVFFLVSPDTSRTYYISPAYEEIWGRSCESLYQNPRSFLEGVHLEDRPLLLAAMERARNGQMMHMEYRVVRPDSTMRWVRARTFPVRDAKGQLLRLAGIAEDITTHKQLESDVRLQEEAFRLVAQVTHDTVWYWDLQTNGLTWGEGFYTHLGYDREHTKPDLSSWIDNLHPDDARRVTDSIHAAIDGGQDSWSDEYRFRRADGNYVDVFDRGYIMRDPSGQAIRMVGAMMDITERKQDQRKLQAMHEALQKSHEELRATQQQIIQQERLSALGQMASGVAHDFNNALAAILGFTELLLADAKSLDDQDKARRQLSLVHTAAEDAAEVVRRLREFYRKRDRAETDQPLDLNQVIQQAVTLTQPRWKDQALASGRTIEVKTDLGEVPEIIGSEFEIREVLTNLLFNAVDAMPDGGTITVRTRVEQEFVALEVSDTGTGMSEEVRRRCLEPFFTTKGLQGGTGLGLAMVYGIVQRCQGTLDLRSEPGQGSTFTIRVPSHVQRPTAAQASEAVSPLRRLHVLLVDDQPLVREALAGYLVSEGHTVETAADGAEGLAKFRAGRFDLVMTDRAMPELSGDQLAVAVKQIAPGKPVILLSGFGDIMQTTGDRPQSVDLTLSKPVTLQAFREALAKVVR